MSSLQMLTQKMRVCRALIIASTVWLAFLICLYYVWDLDTSLDFESSKLSENFEQESMNDDKKIIFNREKFTTFEKVKPKDIATNDKITTKSSEVFAYKKLVTPVSPQLLQELGLVNPGENGAAVILGNVSSDIKEKVKQGWKRHEFNEFVSDLVSVRRTLPDPRQDYCMQKNLYLEKLPSTSVIIIFHNEAWSTLLRSVHTVFDRSPEHLITEVILVDDFSNMREFLI